MNMCRIQCQLRFQNHKAPHQQLEFTTRITNMRQTTLLLTLLFVLPFTDSLLHADLIYGVNATDDGLHQYDSTTGQANLVVEFTPHFSTPIGFDIDPTTGTFFGWQSSGRQAGLFSIDVQTESVTHIGTNVSQLIGDITFNDDGELFGLYQSIYHLASDGSLINEVPFSESIIIHGADFDSSGTLFALGTDAFVVHLYTIDPVTGDVLSDTNLGMNGVAGGLAFDSQGRLFGFHLGGGGTMFEIDPLNGTVLSTTNVSGASVAQGAAFYNAIPEPGALGLLAFCSAGVALRRRRRA